VTALLLILALLVAMPPGVHYQGTVGTGATVPAGPTIASVTSNTATSSATLVLTPSSIPSGAVVVYIYTCWERATGVPTSANLTFTQRAHQPAAGTSTAAIYTAVAASTLTSEAISVTSIGGSERPSGSVVVLTGANAGALTNTATNFGTSASASATVTAVGAASFVLAVIAGTGATASAGADTTTFYAPASPNLNFHGRNTTAGTGSITVTATLTGSVDWNAAAIEIQ
jgi:hypothetical protein